MKPKVKIDPSLHSTVDGADDSLSFKAFLYHTTKALGIHWLVEKIPFLEKRQWVKDFENKELK